ncbi:MAG: hypothetical protein ABIK94_02575 [candidate division WOR-3 bacterium]
MKRPINGKGKGKRKVGEKGPGREMIKFLIGGLILRLISIGKIRDVSLPKKISIRSGGLQSD